MKCADATKGFVFNPVVTSNKITVNGSTTSEKLTAQNATEAAFITYFQVPGVVKTAVAKVRISRNGTALATEALDSGANSPQDLSGHLHFKLGTNFAKKTNITWAMKYTAPYTDKVELLNATNEVIASTTYTVDFSNAIIGTKGDNFIVTPPSTGTGVVAGDIPDSVIILDGQKTIDDIKANNNIT